MIAAQVLAAGATVLALLTAAPAAAEDRTPLNELVDVAAQRLQAADPVAAVKWLSGGPITDPARVAQVLADVESAAGTAGVPTDYVAEVFTDQINATEAIQYARFSGWKFDPASAPTSAPDLSASRARIDELNRRMVTEIAGAWPALAEPGCDSALQSAKDAVAQRQTLDVLYRQALDAATRSYCRGS